MLAVIAIRTIEHNYTAQQLWHRARVPDPSSIKSPKPAKHPSSTFHSTSFSCERIISPIISAHASSSLFCAVASEHSSHSKQPHTGCPRCTVTECDRAITRLHPDSSTAACGRDMPRALDHARRLSHIVLATLSRAPCGRLQQLCALADLVMLSLREPHHRRWRRHVIG